NYQIGSQVVTQDATNNTNRVSQIAGVKPDSTGTIYFSVYNSDGGRAYLNALTIDGVPAAAEKIGQTPVATQSIVRGPGQAVAAANTLNQGGATARPAAGEIHVIAYPNPFVDAMTLSMALTQPVDKLLVLVTDGSGRMLFRQELINLPQGVSAQRLALHGADLPAGTYFVILEGLPGEKARVLQVVKLRR
ncbi:MAG: hypothetical protein Q8943_17075, partial [Bacteroidota bacterium]|nr:hypothetical protein [Bacteroidota bacterium]